MEICMDGDTSNKRKIIQSLRANVDLACQIAEEFTKLYYKYIDKQRNIISRMYMDNAILMWNGNGVAGKDNIQTFWTDLPSSEHTIYTLDAQPIIRKR